MMKALLTTGAVLFLGIATATAQTSGTTGGSTSGTTGATSGGSAGQQMTSAQCQSLWGKADAGSAGSLTQAQAQPYVSQFSRADTNSDGKLSNAEFMAACQQGMVHDTATTGAGSGTTGGAGTSTTSPTTGSGTKK